MNNFKSALVKLFITYIAIIIPLLLIIDWLVTSIIIFGDQSSNPSKIQRLITNENRLEIPIFGSSRALNGYVPIILGDNFYNYGIKAANLEVINLLLKYELKKSKKTPILIDFHPNMLDKNPYRYLDIKDYLPLIKYPLINQFIKLNGRYKIHYSVLGIRYYGTYFDYFKRYIDISLIKNRTFQKGGVFHTTHQRMSIRKPKTFNKVKFNEKLANKFESILKSYPERQFILIESPYHKDYYKKEDEYSNRIEQYLKKIVKFPNVIFIVIDGEAYLDSYFYNQTHLQFRGAKYFSNELKMILVKKGII
ncbi:MAG: hypothetical protein KAH84_08585 [Thiomargarita sp.]|nr:hypothetical protein [Thiomargarita sp.]